MMNPHILKGEFQHPEDGWYQIEARGRHPNRAAGVVQVIDAAACAAIAGRFNADAGAGRLPHGRELLIDHEHFKHDADKETIAYGWLTKLADREDGLYGQIRWTGTGRSAVDGGDYRFFSTEYEAADLEVVEERGETGKSVRPLRLGGLTLTNDPNNKGARPITNRGGQAGTGQPQPASPLCPGRQSNFAGADALAANQPDGGQPSPLATTGGDRPSRQPKQTHIMKNAATKLGLAAEASEEAVLGAVTTLLNRVSTLETENQTLLAEQVDAILDTHAVKEEKLRNRLRLVLAGLQNRAERLAALADFGIRPGDGRVAVPARVLNRGGTTPLDPHATDAQTRRATKVMNRAQALMKDTPNLSLATAFGMAEREGE